jgi:hypothetical protein
MAPLIASTPSPITPPKTTLPAAIASAFDGITPVPVVGHPENQIRTKASDLGHYRLFGTRFWMCLIILMINTHTVADMVDVTHDAGTVA